MCFVDIVLIPNHHLLLSLNVVLGSDQQINEIVVLLFTGLSLFDYVCGRIEEELKSLGLGCTIYIEHLEKVSLEKVFELEIT